MTKKEALFLLNECQVDWNKLNGFALKTKQNVYKNKIFLRGIIEFSNFCRKNCLYCGIRKDSQIERYRMTKSEIISRALFIANNGIKTIVLQSGEDLHYTRGLLSEIITQIKKKCNCAITLCIGERDKEDYKAFREAGADRFLVKHETLNEKVYEKLHPGETLKDRLKIIDVLQKLGYEVGSGNIIGLPFTHVEDYVNDIFLMKTLDVDMAGIGPFVPTKGTPLEGFDAPAIELVLKILTLSRLVLVNVNIPATTALFSLGGYEAVERAIDCGANVLMPNFTGMSYRKKYKIYDEKKPLDIEKIKELTNKKGLKISNSKGKRKKLYGKCFEIRKEKSFVYRQNQCW